MKYVNANQIANVIRSDESVRGHVVDRFRSIV